jgi:hypothetical protein
VVEINGCDVLSGTWQDEGDGIMSIPAYAKVSQLFLNGECMSLARFPDLPSEEVIYDQERYDWPVTVLSKDAEIIETESGFETNFPSIITFSNLSFSVGYWVGGYCCGGHGQNPYQMGLGEILESTGKELTLDSFWGVAGAGRSYIINHLNALDSAGEWYWSEEENKLYFYPPAGIDLNSDLIEGRRGMWGLDLEGRTRVVVENLNFKAFSLYMENATNCTVKNCSVNYLAPFTTPDVIATVYGGRNDGTTGIYVSGSSNLLWRLHVDQSWGAGMRVEGYGNVVDQCEVEHVARLGMRTAGIQAYGTGNHYVRNYIHDVGNLGICGGQRRFGVGRIGWAADVRNNLIVNAGSLSSFDSGHYYVNSQAYGGGVKTVVAYNYMTGFKGVTYNSLMYKAVYTDNGTSGMYVHHNTSPELANHARGGTDNVWTNNGTTSYSETPVNTSAGIEALLTNDSSRVLTDAEAVFDALIPDPERDLPFVYPSDNNSLFEQYPDPVNRIPRFSTSVVAGSVAFPDFAYSGEIIATDGDSDPLTFAKAAGPEWLTVNVDGSLEGTPADGDIGLNCFTVTVEDEVGAADEAILEIDVVPAGSTLFAYDQDVTGARGSSIAIALSGYSSYATGTTYSVVSSPTNGILSGTVPSLLYTSTNGAVGAEDRFTFILGNGEDTSAPATVSILITNGVPVANAQSVQAFSIDPADKY